LHASKYEPILAGGESVSELLRVPEVAQRFSVHPNTVRNWLRSGELRSLRTPGGHYRINPEDVADLLAQAQEHRPSSVVADEGALAATT
jgi:excisionase family DNA binding protein